MGWRFEWKRNWPEVWAPDFQAEWRELYASAVHRTVYHIPDLAFAWAETVGNATHVEPLVGVGRDDRGRRVLLPWVVKRYGGRFLRRRCIEPLGADLFGYHDPLAAGDQTDVDWADFWRAARQ